MTCVPDTTPAACVRRAPGQAANPTRPDSTGHTALGVLRDTLAEGLATQGHAGAQGRSLAAALGLGAAAWHAFAAHWDRLSTDRFMADGGTYRLRRYGSLLLRRPGRMALLPHAPYHQPRHINPLNGDVQRHFEPLEPGFVDHAVLAGVVGVLAQAIDRVEGQAMRWRVDLHAYRILARPGCAGLPTPEGRHRDGVDYIATLMVRRTGVRGGATTVTDTAGRRLLRRTLRAPMDLLVADDLHTLHDVSPLVACGGPDAVGHRDVLVIAFTRAAD